MNKAEFEFKLVDSMSNPLDKIKRSAAGVDDAMKSAASSSGGLGMLKSMVGGNLIAGGIQMIGSSLMDMAKFAMKAGVEMEKARISYQVLTGDVEKGNKLFAQTSEFANVTPFNTDEVQKAGKTLMAFGVAAEDIIPTMNTIGDISALSSRSFDDMAMIYGKVVANGKLMGAELNMLVDAGFNPLMQISERTGESMAALRKRMELGQIGVAEVQQAFIDATGEGGRFNGGMDKISKTIGGKWSTLMGKITFAVGGLVESMNGFFTTIIDGLISVTDWMTKNVDTLIVVGYTVAGLGAAWLAYSGYLAIVAAVTSGLTIKQLALNIAMSANPIGIVVVLIGGLIAAFVALYKTNDKVKGFFDGIWGSIKKFGSNIANFVKKTFHPFIEAWRHFKEGNYGASAKALAMGAFNVTPVGLLTNAASLGEGVLDAYSSERNKSLMKSAIQKKKEEDEAKEKAGGGTEKSMLDVMKEQQLKDGANGFNGSTKAKAKDKSTTSVTGASSGRPTHINVEIDSLVKEFNIQAQNLEQIQRQVKDAVSRALTSAVNDVNLVAGS